jgi:hypothetical protein
MFKLLRGLSTDATFDQIGRLSSFSEANQFDDIFSFDLSSATDLIPLELTVSILEIIWGPISHQWKDLLVDRDYHSDYGVFRYSRGQPIGALSSWSALAVTHHWLVQYAAFLADKFPYSNYVILGDDVSIAGAEVADKYVELCKEFSVPINNKGIISRRKAGEGSLVNFANQIMIGSVNYSPIQIREEMSVTNSSVRAEALSRLIVKGFLDIKSPKFLSQAFRHCVSSSLQLREGFESFSRGFLPDGFEEVLANLLHPGPAKSWSLAKEEPLTYVYIRLLAGLDIIGGWSSYFENPKQLSGKLIPKKELLLAFYPLIPQLWMSVAQVLSNLFAHHRSLTNDYTKSWFDRIHVLSMDGPKDPVSASYHLALDHVKLFLERQPELSDAIPLVLAHNRLINFEGDISLPEFIKRLVKFLDELDAMPPAPRLFTDISTVKVGVEVDPGSMYDVDMYPVPVFMANGVPFPHQDGYEEFCLAAGIWTHDARDLWAYAGGIKGSFVKPENEDYHDQAIALDVRILPRDIDDRLFLAGRETVSTETRVDFLSDVSKAERAFGKAPRSIRVLRTFLASPTIRRYLTSEVAGTNPP